MIKIEKINIRDFRGIRNLSIKLENRNILVLGENGTGKSSVVDALEFFFTGKVEKLSGRQDIREKDSITNTVGDSPEVAILFSSSPDEVKVTYPYSVQSISPEIQPFYSLAATRVFILRRAQLLRFIEARGSERYDIVSDLIGLGILDSIENVWREKVTQLKSQYEAVKKQLSEVSKQLSATLGGVIKTEESIIKLINIKLTQNNLEPILYYEDLALRQKSLLLGSANPDNIKKAEQLRGLNTSIEKIRTQSGKIQENYVLVYTAWQEFLSQAEGADETEFEKILLEAQPIIQREALEYCPLCEENIRDLNQLRLRLGERLQLLEKFTASRKKIGEENHSFQQLLQNLISFVDELKNQLVFHNLTTESSSLLSAKSGFEILLKNLKITPLQLHSIESFLADERFTRLIDSLDKLQQIINAKIDTLVPTEEESKTLELVEFLGNIITAWNFWKTSSKTYNEEEILYKQVDIVYNALLEARRNGLERIKGDLQKDLISLYESLHPGEGYQAFNLIISPGKRKSIGLEAFQNGMGIMHPMGILSEGHLDSLGLCVFLAFIKRFNEDLKIIVLDDVLTSIDAGHRMRVARLIAKEFDEYQIFLTTHDEMWANELVTVFKNSHKPIKYARLKPWNLDEGTVVDDYEFIEWDYLREQIDSGHKQDAIANVGRNLEKFLAKMRRNLHLAVPATMDDIYTIGQLYDPFFTWVEKHKIERLDFPNWNEEIKIIRDELDDYWRLRNWSGAHYNKWGEKVSEGEAHRFVEIVKDLITSLECPVCSSLVIYDSDTKLLHCSICAPEPKPIFIQQFKQNWHNHVDRLLQTSLERGDKKYKEFAVNNAQASFNLFLRDMRNLLRLAVPPVPGEKYEISDLYDPFITHIKTKPNIDDLNWEDWVEHQDEELLTYMKEGELAWDKEKIMLNTEAFIEQLKTTIEHLQCRNCQSLLAYNGKTNKYACIKCSSSSAFTQTTISAHWLVTK